MAGSLGKYSPGERKPVTLFVKGHRQEVPYLSDDREIAANGYLRSPTLWTRTRRM